MKEDYKFNQYEALKKIIQTTCYCYQNVEFSQQLIYIILRAFLTINDLECIGYMEALSALLNIKDTYFEKRMKLILGVPGIIANKFKEDGEYKYKFGISKENSLKRNMIIYNCNFGNIKSLLDLIFSNKEVNESKTLVFIFYLLNFAMQDDDILEYLLNLPPNNYVSYNVLDWMKGYVEYQLKVLPTSYQAPKPELMYLYFNHLPEKIENLQKRVNQYLVTKKNYSEEDAKGFNLFISENEEHLSNLKDVYMIGQTLNSNLFEDLILDTDENGRLTIMIDFIEVYVMKYQSNGISNSQIPKKFLNYEFYLNKSDLSDGLEIFIGTQTNSKDDKDNEDIEDNSNYKNLVPIGDEEENEYTYKKVKDDIKEEQVKPIKESKPQQKEIDISQQNFIASKYIAIVSVSNTTDHNYYINVEVSSSKKKPNHQIDNYANVVKSDSKQMLSNLNLFNANGNWEGLQIDVIFGITGQQSIQNCSNSNFLDTKTPFVRM